MSKQDRHWTERRWVAPAAAAQITARPMRMATSWWLATSAWPARFLIARRGARLFRGRIEKTKYTCHLGRAGGSPEKSSE